MTSPPGRSAAVRHAVVGVRIGAPGAGLLAALLAGLLVGCAPSPVLTPEPTQAVAVTTAPPAASPAPSATPGTTPGTTPTVDVASPEPTAEPSPGSDPTIAPPGTTAIVPGKVDRSSLDVSATYRVTATITVGTGAIDVTTRIEARNDSGDGIDRLELNTIAARLGGIFITMATVDDRPVKVAVRDQTLVVPLGGVLPDGASATVRIAYRATLRIGLSGSDWMFTRARGTLALYRWIPWISKAVPFDRPNQGAPFVTTTSERVDVELLTDQSMVLAGPTAVVEEFAAGAGSAWSFSVANVRDVSVILAPDFRVARGEANGIPIRAFTRPGGLSGPDLVAQAADALTTEAGLLGVGYPSSVLTVVETQGGYGLESPGLIWIPATANTLNRSYLVYQGTAHQWFYGLVGSNQQSEPFADEGPADVLARTALGTLRSSHCPRDALDRAITGYSLSCYYEVVLVQGGEVLDAIRGQMGTKPFWKALGTYLEDHRLGIAGSRQLLEALRAGSKANLMPILKARFPALY